MGIFYEYPKCPGCGSNKHAWGDEKWWEKNMMDAKDGSEWVALCGDCGKNYNVKVCFEAGFVSSSDHPLN